ncbi:MAG: tRNA uridine-5-carboxymethylaminomethyl(34) synthesis GTPase MnmE [Bacteroidetes bacterium]|nr:MAG: tRNA uridine-5-carboxymethylaminomethyl(34) synthesis GTPase MnmE [Bacteroidota bacterium]
MTNLPHTDTICAISTAAGVAAISVLRISGDQSFEICNKLFKPGDSSKDISTESTFTIHYGFIMDDKDIVDEVLISLFKNPNSYTGEDLIEISCHGSTFVQQKILELLISAGARTAKPGEFTMRAFLNGKMDLTKAEAVADLIASSTAASHKTAMSQMRGGFSEELKVLRQKLLDFASLVELELDFSEEDVEFADRKALAKLIEEISSMLHRLVDSFRLGNVIKNGVPVAIIGKPNVGKSTLLNVLINEERAIVSDIPGTTRDYLEDSVNIDGILYRFIDTAGIRDSTDEIEAKGISKTFEKIREANVILYLFDAKNADHNQVEQELKELEVDDNVNVVAVINKIDQLTEKELNNFKKLKQAVCISALNKENIESLHELLVSVVSQRNIDTSDTIITNARHYEELSKSLVGIESVINGLDEKISGELLAADIRESLQHLGEITGEVTNNELLGNIFSRFCIGK